MATTYEWDVDIQGFVAEGTVYGKCAVVWGTNPSKQVKVPTGATYIVGVVYGGAREAFLTTKAVDVARSGIVEICATAAVITAGQAVYVDTDGRVTAVAGGAATQYAIGIAQTTTAGSLDDLCSVLLGNIAVTVHA